MRQKREQQIAERAKFTPKVAVALLTVLFVFLFLGLMFASPWLDTLDIQTSRCTVVSAEPRTSSGVGKGATTLPSVLIKTKECGNALLSGRGITFDNIDELAKRFHAGDVYEFGFGWFTRVISKPFLGDKLPIVHGYRKVG